MRIRKFNESISNNLDTDYIEECFIDFIDSGAEVEKGDNYGDGRSYFELVIPFPDLDKVKLYKSGVTNIDDRLSLSENLVEFYNNVKICTEMVKSKYDHIDVRYTTEKGRFVNTFGNDQTFEEYYDESLFVLFLPKSE